MRSKSAAVNQPSSSRDVVSCTSAAVGGTSAESRIVWPPSGSPRPPLFRRGPRSRTRGGRPRTGACGPARPGRPPARRDRRSLGEALALVLAEEALELAHVALLVAQDRNHHVLGDRIG